MLTIVFYATDGAAAKAHSREIAAVKGDYARTIDVGFWDDAKDRCDAVEIMPDVPKWQRKRITNVYGDMAVDSHPSEGPIEIEQPARQQLGLMPEKEKEAKPKLEAKHRGGGRWFVMEGDSIISGPHDKVEALRLVSES